MLMQAAMMANQMAMISFELSFCIIFLITVQRYDIEIAVYECFGKNFLFLLRVAVLQFDFFYFNPPKYSYIYIIYKYKILF